jgi:hypothetical protein
MEASDESVQRYVAAITRWYPEWIDPNASHHGADVFVIAVAMRYKNSAVVSQERRHGNKRAIPAICEKESIRCMDLLGFMVEEGKF